MQNFNQLVLFTHIAAGFTALIVGAVPIIAEKGGLIHRRAGLIFFYAMLILSVAALWLVAFKGANIFLGFIGVFSFYNAYSGKRILTFKSTESKPILLDYLMLISLTINGLYMLYMVLRNIVAASTDWSMVILYGIFGLFCLAMAREDWLFFRSMKLSKYGKMHWFFTHMTRMMGAYIATWTAFIVVNYSNMGLPEQFGVLAWILPGVIGGFFISRSVKHFALKKRV